MHPLDTLAPPTTGTSYPRNGLRPRHPIAVRRNASARMNGNGASGRGRIRLRRRSRASGPFLLLPQLRQRPR